MNRNGQQRFLWRESDRLNPPKRVPQERVRDFCEIDSLSDAKTIRMQAARCVQCAEPACVAACPLHNRIPEWLELAAEGCFLEAADLSRETSAMPGSRKEYQHALEEGARFLFLTNPTEILGDDQGRVAGVRCQRMELGGADASGRRKPQAVAGSDFTVAAELVLVAYGFDPAPHGPASDLAGVKVNAWGAAEVDESQQTNLSRVYAGGDVVRGPSLVVHAIRDGRRAAEAMHRHFEKSGDGAGDPRERRLQAQGA